jgi:hypothetical protein
MSEFSVDLHAGGAAPRDCGALPGFTGGAEEVRAGEERDLSELLQHEIDHLDGILAVDRITDIRTMCTREEFEKRYREGSPYAVLASKG